MYKENDLSVVKGETLIVKVTEMNCYFYCYCGRTQF